MQTDKLFLAFGLGLLLAAGCATSGDKEDVALRLHEQISSTLPSKLYREVQVPKTGLTLQVDRYPALTERDVHSAELYPTAGGAAILLRMEPGGAFALDELTTRSRGRYLVTFLNGRPVAAWLVDKRITNGQMLLVGDFTDEEARKTVDSLNRMSKRRNSQW